MKKYQGILHKKINFLYGDFYLNHEGCGEDLYLNQNAKLFCNSCFGADFVFRWKFINLLLLII